MTDYNLVRGTAGADLFQVYWDRGRDSYFLVSGGEMSLSGSAMEIVLTVADDPGVDGAAGRHAKCEVTVGSAFKYSKEITSEDIERNDLMQKAANHFLELEHGISEQRAKADHLESRIVELDHIVAERDAQIGKLSTELHEERLENQRTAPDFQKAQSMRGSLEILARHLKNILKGMFSRARP